VRLDVRGLRTAVWPAHAIDLRVRAGEIVGLAGLVGSGRSELLETLFGARAADDPGRVEVDGRPLPAGDILASVRQGLALVPEDRKQQGLLLEMSVQSNLTLASLRDHCTRKMRALGVLSPSRERDAARAAIDRLDVRVSDPERAVSELSGGNQQKVVLGKWLARTPAVLLLDEPTRGVDIAAKDEIYARMEELAAEGLAIVFASSEMAEILSIADRILVLHEGRIAGELPGEGSTEESVMRLATGAESKGGSA
jgi:ribose transport system ATP-binding protein